MTQPVLQSPGAEVAPEEVENTNALKSSSFIQYKPNVIRGIALCSLPAEVSDPKSLLVTLSRHQSCNVCSPSPSSVLREIVNNLFVTIQRMKDPV